jgi:CheY-like chemotaxis protein
MFNAAVGAALVIAGLGVAFFMPLVVTVALVCVVPFVLVLGLYNLLRIKEKLVGMKSPIKVLIIDDDIDSALVTARAFTSAGWQTDIATTPSMALDYLYYSSPSLVVLDWALTPILSGRELLQNASLTLSERDLRVIDGPVPVVSLSSSPPQAITYDESAFFKHTESWQKPFNLNEMVSAAGRMARSVAV